jgi:hypothetical protein
MYLSAMSHTSIIDLWPSLADFASDLGVPYGTAKAMRRRGSIPSSYWAALVRKAVARQIKGVSLEALAVAKAAA